MRIKSLLNPWAENRKLRARKEFLLDEIGVYPRSTEFPDGRVKERTEWQEGWNAAVAQFYSNNVTCCKPDWDYKHFLREQKKAERENISYKTLWLRSEKRRKRKVLIFKIKKRAAEFFRGHF